MKPNDLPINTKVVENLLKMKQALLDQPEERFNMDVWRTEVIGCGTACCLLGTYIEAYGDETGMYFDSLNAPQLIGSSASDYPIAISSKAIGITQSDASLLFLPINYDYNIISQRIPKDKVLKRLNEMIKKYSSLGE